MKPMSDDTKRALETIQPMANELGIQVRADGQFLYCNGQAIGIGCNSAWATINEFIAYAFLKIWAKDKYMYCEITDELMDRIKRYWFTPEQLEQVIRAEGGEYRG